MPEEFPYSLGGWGNKTGYRFIRGKGLDNAKPEFLVHMPGDMGGNYAIIEVKPIKAVRREINKDIGTLSAFINDAEYFRAIYLVYGRDIDGNGLDIAQEECQICDARQIEIWYHPAPNQPATRID